MPAIAKQPMRRISTPAKKSTLSTLQRMPTFDIDLTKFTRPSDQAIHDRLKKLHNPPGE